MIDKKKNRDKMRAWRLKNKEKCKEKDRSYYLENKEHILSRNKIYDEEHLIEKRERLRRFRKKNKEKINFERRKEYNIEEKAIERKRFHETYEEEFGFKYKNGYSKTFLRNNKELTELLTIINKLKLELWQKM